MHLHETYSTHDHQQGFDSLYWFKWGNLEPHIFLIVTEQKNMYKKEMFSYSAAKMLALSLNILTKITNFLFVMKKRFTNVCMLVMKRRTAL